MSSVVLNAAALNFQNHYFLSLHCAYFICFDKHSYWNLSKRTYLKVFQNKNQCLTDSIYV